ncbi:MAG: DNA integrity scanning diadenylate cyclase DisA [Thermoactinomyces sp.]
MRDEGLNDHDNSNIIQMIAPGTPLREGLDNVVGAKTGALIVIGFDEGVREIVDGGFYIDCPFTPAHLYELAKMDGAIILSNDRKKILYANAQLVPDSSIPSTETGIRHRTAQRTARQTGKLVVSISQRRNIITLYKGNFRYALKDIGVILTKANQAVQTLEKYKSVLDQTTTNLTALEFEELVTLSEVALVLQRVEMVLRIKREIERYIHELGTEGRLISMQLDELVSDTEKEAELLIKDYCTDPGVSPSVVFQELQKLSADDLLKHSNLIRLLGYPASVDIQEEAVIPRGYRILYKIPRLPGAVIQKLVERFENLSRIMIATTDELDDVEGIGNVRAKMIKDGLKRVQEQVFIDRHI